MATSMAGHAHDAVHQGAAWRVVADVVQRWVATVGLVGCGIQVAFAAYGFWAAQSHPGDEAFGRQAFASHAITGEVLQYLALAMLLFGILSRADVKGWVVPLIVALLLFGAQGPLVGLGFDVNPWFGALHALDGMVITAGFGWLAVSRWLHPMRE